MKVLACDGIHEDGLALLRDAGWEVVVSDPIKDPAELARALGDVDVLLVRSATRVPADVLDDAGQPTADLSIADIRAAVGENNTSLAKLGELAAEDPPFVPAFFMAGQQLVRLGRVNEARTFLRDGIEAARTQGNAHAAGEMSGNVL